MDITEEINKRSEELINLIRTLSSTVNDNFPKIQQQAWLNTLLGYKEDLICYKEVISPSEKVENYRSTVIGSSNIINCLNELSNEDRNKFLVELPK